MPGTEQNNKPMGGMMNARIAGGNFETTNFDKVSNGGRTPVPPVPPAPPAPSTTHQDMYKAVTKAPLSEADEQAKRKKQRKQSTLAAIIDGLSALGNVWFATRGANATGTTNLSKGVSGKWKDYWDQVRKDRDAYNKGLLQARQMDYNADVRKLERAEDKAERDARAANDEKWRQKEWDRNEQRYQEGIAYRDSRDAKMDERYENERKEDTRRYNKNLGLQYQQHNDNKNLREAQINATKARGLRGKQIGFVNGEGKQVSIYENVWRGSMQQVFDTLVKELTSTDEGEKKYKYVIRDLDTPQKKEDFVKQNWHKSPGASQIMLTLSGIDPATMTSKLNDDVENYTPSGGDDEVIDYTPGNK